MSRLLGTSEWFRNYLPAGFAIDLDDRHSRADGDQQVGKEGVLGFDGLEHVVGVLGAVIQEGLLHNVGQEKVGPGADAGHLVDPDHRQTQLGLDKLGVLVSSAPSHVDLLAQMGALHTLHGSLVDVIQALFDLTCLKLKKGHFVTRLSQRCVDLGILSDRIQWGALQYIWILCTYT